VTTALNGQRQVLQMQKGTTEQVECLSSADAYISTSDSFVDVANIFQQKHVCSIELVTFDKYFTESENYVVVFCRFCLN